MVKMHTRIKRKIGLNTHFRHYRNSSSVVKTNGPKTFNTEESAHACAAKQNLSPEQYFLKPAKRNKKFIIVIKEGKDKKVI